jgi:hypothetical protein
MPYTFRLAIYCSNDSACISVQPCCLYQAPHFYSHSSALPPGRRYDFILATLSPSGPYSKPPLAAVHRYPIIMGFQASEVRIA